jgi:hypothetical protein
MGRKAMSSMHKMMIAVLFASCALLAGSWQQVEQKFQRCQNRMERVRQQFESFRASAQRLGSLRNTASISDTTRFDNFLTALRAKEEYLTNRVERTRNMGDQLRRDIDTQSKKSTSCPECIVSSIDLFCRHGESLEKELRKQIIKIRQFERSVQHDIGEESKDAAVESLDEIMKNAGEAVEKTGNAAAKKVYDKAVAHFKTFQQLRAKGKKEAAGKEAEISRKLAEKAIEISRRNKK